MNGPNETSGVWRKALVKLGLAYPPEGAPREGTASRSRYGAFPAPLAESRSQRLGVHRGPAQPLRADPDVKDELDDAGISWMLQVVGARWW
jgi:hypothetical protein